MVLNMHLAPYNMNIDSILLHTIDLSIIINLRHAALNDSSH